MSLLQVLVLTSTTNPEGFELMTAQVYFSPIPSFFQIMKLSLFSQRRHFLTQSLFIKKVFSSEIVFFVEEERNFRPELLVTAFVKILSLCDVTDAFLINRDCFVYTSLEKFGPSFGNLWIEFVHSYDCFTNFN